MLSNDKYEYRLYAETASLLADLYFKKRITKAEMHFLLNILESVIIKKDNASLLDILKKWQDANKEDYINSIIKETLLTIDFSDQESLLLKEGIISELLEC